MKKIILSLFILLVALPAFSQKEIMGFTQNKTITIDGTEYLLSDGYICLDYSYIAIKDQFKSLYGKFPAYGVVNSNNEIIIPCEYAAIQPFLDKGVFAVMRCTKAMFNPKYGMFDFEGNEVVPVKVGQGSLTNPFSKVNKAYDKLAQSVKDQCISTFNLKSNQFYGVEGEDLAVNQGPVNNNPQKHQSQNKVSSTSSSSMQNQTAYSPQNEETFVSDVDINIPVTDKKSENTFVLIIANEDYIFVDDVDFALNDGRTFKKYCIQTLGIPERQIWHYENASGGIIAGGVDKMVQAMDLFDNARAIVYYCGHGIPDEKTGDAYIIPTDGKGTNVATCYSLGELYKCMANSKASDVTYFMDACFSGANKNGSMLVAARGVAREAKKETLEGRTVVFSAASGDETAMAYSEKKHGLFTYYLLKKLQETKGDVSYKELADYIKTSVKKESFLTNEKIQVPNVLVSNKIINTWGDLKLK